ncbi:MAG: HAMP domain-containing histidine kinase [Treponema sp.]|nr:HAMP domain-containing histidine kinase [Treponema sp.]
MKKIKSSIKLTLAFSALIFFVVIFFSFISFYNVNKIKKQNIEREIINAFFEIQNFFISNSFFQFTNDISYIMREQTNLPYYLVFSIYDKVEKKVLMTNDPFLPLLEKTKPEKCKKYFQKNFFSDGDLNIIYYCSELFTDNENIFLQTAIDIKNDSIEEIINLFIIFAISSIPLFFLTYAISKFFAKTFQKLEKDYDREKQFTSDVSHELKTPLAVILGHTELLMRWGKNETDILEESLKTIHNEAKSINLLIENLLILSRIDNNEKSKLSVKLENINISEIFQTLIENTKILKPDAIVKTQCKKTDSFFCNKNILLEALRIIMDNALKYSKEKPFIILGFEKNTIFVKDNGIGITQEDLKYIFQRFYRVEKSRNKKTGGTGLGLAIAKNILALTNCKIKADSILGEGTTIFIYK